MIIDSHTFCDASEVAYSAVTYFRLVKSDGEIATFFVMAKARVAPLRKVSERKELTIPKLELQAAVLGAKLTKTIRESSNGKSIANAYFWTDSLITLYRIKSTKKKRDVFVNNRVIKIKEITEVSNWKWIPTEFNTADEATRGQSSVSKIIQGQWLTGPVFLSKNESDWPTFSPPQKEMVAAIIQDVEDGDGQTKWKSQVNLREALPDPNRFSSFIRFKRCGINLFFLSCGRL